MLRTERLLIRKFEMSDTDALLDVFGDAEVMHFGDGPHERAWVERWLVDHMQGVEARGYGPYAVVELEGGRMIGYCGLFTFPDINGQPEVEIGYRLRRSSWGKGYATEAARAVRDLAFHELSLKRLIALIDPANTASIRVAEKIGMRYEADVMLEGYTHPDRVYVISAAQGMNDGS
jgi:RimJ/RimL family protein N-acetyltransferase